MRKARSVNAPSHKTVARAPKRSLRLVAVFALLAVAAAAALSAPTSARLVGSLMSAAAAPAADRATVTTDRSVYEPGETVTFSGSNFEPGENVTIVVTSGSHDEARATIQATADDKGSFIVKATMPELEEEEERERERESHSKAEVIFKAVAKGAASGSSARTHFKGREREEEEGEDDADLPRFMVGRIGKEDYLSRRQEHVNRLRGVERGRPFDPGARGRAIRELDRQQGKNKKDSEFKGASVTGAAASAAEAQTATNDSGASAAGTVNFAMAGAPGWTSVGPAPIPNGQTFGVTHAVSGRVTAIAVHPTNSDIAYVAAAQGGVYRTLDGGQTWTAIFDNSQSLAVGALALSPSQPSTLYVGTGEGNFSCDSFFGVGVYRIDNADGSTPALSGPFAQDTAANDVLTGRSISKIVVHPTNSDVIFIGVTNGIGGMGCDAGTATAGRGLYRSTNATSANATFQKITLNTANAGNRSVTDIEFEPGNPNTMLATVNGFNSANDGGVYRSTNALAATPTFTRTLTMGTASATARGELAVNKVGGVTTVYAASSDSNGTVFRSLDGGQTWSAALANATGFCGTQCTYDMPIAVDPTNANVLYIGGNADGTLNAILKKSTNATAATPTFAKIQNGLHADSHAIEVDPSNNNTVWFGSDGGVWKSANGGANWTSLNNTGFNATQFQSLALHPIDPNYAIGGTQDNGTERQRPDGTWTRTDFGDGGYALIDQSATNTTTVRQYHTYFNQAAPTALASTLMGFGTTTSSTAFENWTLMGCNGGTSNNGISCSDTAVLFYAPMALGPGTPNTVYFGTDKLYRSANSGTTMTAVSQTFASGVAVSAIGISVQNDNVRIVGLRNGKVYATTTGATTMTDVTGTIPARYISRAVIDPNNQNTAYVALSTYFGNAGGHVYKTTNLNSATPTWTALGGAQMPDVPVNAFVVDPADSNTLYAGTDIGVYRSSDAGATWTAFSEGLPRVAVFDMAVHNASRKLRIATHGRGIWEISVANSPAVIRGNVTDAGTNAPIANATVTAGSNTTTTDENGFYQFPSIPAGSYNMTVTAIGYANGTATGVTATNGAITTRDFALTGAASAACNVDTTLADFQSGLGANTEVNAPGDMTLALPSAVINSQTSLAIFSNNITATTWQAQTFTPTASGKLTQMDFQAALGTTGVPGTLVVEIRNVASGVPGGTVLASANLTTIAGTGNAWYGVTFAAPPIVAAGTQYALVFRAGAGGPFRAVSSSSNVYAGGNWQQSSTSGASWANITSGGQTLDLAFSAYIIPQTYATSGNFVSSPKDANQADGTAAGWTTISWNATTPAGTDIKFQAAGSNNAGGLFTFVGPDGTPNTYFTNGGSLAQFNGSRYLKYKAYFSTTNTALTPTLADVTVCNSNTPLPATSLSVAAATGVYGTTTTLTATLTSGGGPLAGKPVVFKLNNANFAGNTATTDANGVATITNVSLAGLNAGTYAGYVTARYASDSSYAGSNGANDLTVEKATPSVVWNNPAAIVYGTALGASELNATANVPGAFVYTPASGTVLNAGDNQTLSAQFNPADATNYNTVLKEVLINVLKAPATIALNGLTFDYDGTPKSATATTTPAGLNGLTVTYNGSATAPTGAGSYAVVASLANANYSADDATGTLVINKVAPVVKANGVTCIYNGSPCEANGTATGVDGVDLGAVTLVYTPGGSAPVNAGDYTVVASIPETANHTAGTSEAATVKVNKATPVINWSNPSAIVYGTPLGATQLNATADTAGTFVYTPAAGTVLGVGNGQTLHADFTPADAANYTTASKDVSINVVKATLTITTVNTSKVYGQPNPTFAVTYAGFLNGDTPAVLGGALTFTTSATQSSNAGVYPVTPSGLTSSNYAINFVAGNLTITKAPLTVTANNAVKILGAPNPQFTVSYAGFVLNQGPNVLGGTLSFTTAANATSPVGNYAVTPSGLTSQNYSITYVDGTLSITYGVCALYDQEKAAQSNSTIPIKLQLCNAGAADVSTPTAVVHATSVVMVSTQAPAQLADSGNANPDFNFRYVGGTPGSYIFNLSTKGYASGTYLLNFVVSGDPVPHSVKFSVR
ncbi:MAG TPA: MBG domain-containing protein [Pyrinomonadaceae bacterium]